MYSDVHPQKKINEKMSLKLVSCQSKSLWIAKIWGFWGCSHNSDIRCSMQVVPRCPRCPPDEPLAIMKPDIVFFGENLPEQFHRAMKYDKNEVDLLIVIGSSLKVRPVALIPSKWLTGNFFFQKNWMKLKFSVKSSSSECFFYAQGRVDISKLWIYNP